MFPEGPNPYKVQTGPKNGKNLLPLVLIHDGGGTTTGFWALESLNRDVWVIHNPHFWSEEPWEGGMDEMAQHYIGLLKDAGIKGTILLGGWSLGGHLSVAMARMLGGDPSHKIKIAGLVLIDVPHYFPWYDQEFAWASEPLLTGVPPRVQRTLDYCKVLLHAWSLPAWDGPALGGEDVHFSVGGAEFSIPPDSVLYRPFGQSWSVKPIPEPAEKRKPVKRTSSKPVPLPPAVLFRCINHHPTVDGGDTCCRIDSNRKSPMLGWENYPAFIKAVMEVDKTHYTLFDTTDRPHVSSIEDSVAFISACLCVSEEANRMCLTDGGLDKDDQPRSGDYGYH